MQKLLTRLGILTVVLILTGCQTTAPTCYKPRMTAYPIEGGILIDNDDASDLISYIDCLESRT